MLVVIGHLATAFNAADLHAKAEMATRVQDAVESGVAIDPHGGWFPSSYIWGKSQGLTL